MDPGNFFTDSGSKIPQPRGGGGRSAIPAKPNLCVGPSKNINFVSVPEQPTSNLQKSRIAGTTKSIPNLTKASNSGLSRSKTNINKAVATKSRTVPATPAVGSKRQASVDDIVESCAKVAKAAPKSAFPYKAKSWELKLRIAECEEWVTDLRTRVRDLEDENASNTEAIAMAQETRAKLEEETCRADQLELQLREKTAAYEKLYSDSRNSVDIIRGLESDVLKRQHEIDILQGDLKRLREESLANAAEISRLKFSLDDVEFKFRRQKNTLDDVEASYNQCKNTCSGLQSRLREKEEILADTEDKLKKSERENDYKAKTIEDLENENRKERSKVSELEKDLREKRGENNSLSSDLSELKKQLTTAESKIIELTNSNEDMRSRMCDNEKLRRYMHNQVQDLKGNIRVFCRVRPALLSEKENLMCSLNFPDEGSIEISKADPFENTNTAVTSRPKFQKHDFTFDRVFNPSATQAIVFDELAQLVQSALDGYNVCIFAYGQTGSGKTYTMEGPNTPEARGMIPRTVLHIFDTVKDLQNIGWEYTVEVCFIEIYNEIIKDLLRSDKEGANLKIMQVDAKTNDVVIPGLTVMKVNDYSELDRLYLLAHQNRATASTCYNERSSRSHSVTKIKVTGVHKERGETCYGSLNLVDLAGSERLVDSVGADNPRLREMKNINKSLSELGNVILGLYQKNEHIPYRNSKLTHLLQPALGGSSKTLMLVNISPLESCLSETLCSLRFAQKVNQVKVGTSKKRIMFDGAVPK